MFLQCCQVFTNIQTIFYCGLQRDLLFIGPFNCELFNWVWFIVKHYYIKSFMFLLHYNLEYAAFLHFRENLSRMIRHLNKIFNFNSIQDAGMLLHNIGNTSFQDYIFLLSSEMLIENTSSIIYNYLKLKTKHISHFHILKFQCSTEI